MKKYIQPSITIHEVLLQSMIAGSLGMNDNEGEGGKDAVRGRRGSNHRWGDLWDEED